MLLLVDVGNTQTVIGVFDGLGGLRFSRKDGAGPDASNGASDAPGDGEKGAGAAGEYRAMWRISTDKSDTADDLRSRLAPLFEMSGIGIDEVRRACVASVVPSLSVSWEHAVKKVWGVEAVMCTAPLAHEAGLFDADYPRPAEIGADRVADAIAANALYGAPVVVVDFGTATNIEVIGEDGHFMGGVIAPGVTTGASALFSHATQIAATGMFVPENVIGKSTTEAVQSGVIYGEVGRVDGLLERIFDELGRRCRVVATGGLVHTISNLSRNITDVCPELTLDGLRMLAEAIEEQQEF